MATLKLGNKKDIKQFFKILAEESVKQAKNKAFFDKDAEDLMKQVAKDKKAFKAKAIVEEEGDDEDLEDLIDDAEDEDVDSNEFKDEPSTDNSKIAKIEDVSLDAIQKKIMLMRSAPSVKDSATEQRLSDYLQFLSKEEKIALLAFVEALSGLMTGETPADSAPDPSDPPYNVTMKPSSEDVEVDEDVEVEEDIDDSEEEIEVEEEVDDSESEPEAVPIQVGSVQESSSIKKIRNRVRELLSRS